MSKSYGLKEIAKDLLAGKLPSTAAPDLARERMKICQACPEFRKIAVQCELCGCFLELKTKLLEASCPADKW
jgi:hypothetical protein